MSCGRRDYRDDTRNKIRLDDRMRDYRGGSSGDSNFGPSEPNIRCCRIRSLDDGYRHQIGVE